MQSELLVADIAKSIDKTPRGVKTMLTHRGIDCKDHKGAAKKEKAVAAAATAA